MPGLEIPAVDKWLTGRVTGDTTVVTLIARRFYCDTAPDVDPDDPDGKPPAYPMSVFHIPHSPDTTGGGGARVMSRPQLIIKVIGEGSGIGDLVPVQAAIDALLLKAPAADVMVGPERYTILGAVREGVMQTSETLNGLIYHLLIAAYRVYVQQS